MVNLERVLAVRCPVASVLSWDVPAILNVKRVKYRSFKIMADMSLVISKAASILVTLEAIGPITYVSLRVVVWSV